MRHQVNGRKFGRNTSHRMAMFRNMANSVIEQERVVTTLQKAKEVRRVVDRLVTLGKHGKPADRRMAFDRTRSNEVVAKVFGTLAERYKNRDGGYTRILKLSDRRRGDGAELAVLELVDHPTIDRRKKTKEEGSKASAISSDPFSGVRRLFGGTKKKSREAAKAGNEAQKATETKKAAATSEAGEKKKPAAKKKKTAKKKTKKS